MKKTKALFGILTILVALPQIANADIIDFTGINLGAVASLSGQTFAYTDASGGATGMVTVLLVTGSPSAVQTGSIPDTTGFYALQTGDNLTPMVFRFTFDVPRSFTITQNEYLANLEVNSFTLPSGAWNLVSMAYTIATTNGSNLTFVGQNGAPPYGTFVIAGTGASFDFGITNAPGYPEYGSAISINVGPVTPVGPAIITWTNPAPLIYGTPLSSNQLNATANVPGNFAYNPTNGTVLNVGTNTLSVIFTPTDTVDYSSVTDSVSLVVVAPSPTINIQKAVYLTSTNLLVGLDYQVQASSDFINWTNQGSVFTATNSNWQSTNYWNVNDWNQLLFQLQVLP